MSERIVVGFLQIAEDVEEQAYAESACTLRDKAEARGARPCACEARSLAFDFAQDEVEEAIDFAVSANERSALPWSVGISQGEMRVIVDAGDIAVFGWGPPLVKAMALAHMARRGEVLADPAMPCVATGEILAGDTRYGRDGKHKMRGVVLDERRVWRRDTVSNVAKVVRPELVARHSDLNDILASHAALAVVRAEPGAGGTRLLEEVAAALLPGRSLFLEPAGAEPLGSLRRAFIRATRKGAGNATDLPERLSAALERLMAGDGVEVPIASELVAAWVTKPKNGSVLVDDATEVDDPSLEVVATAAKLAPGLFRPVIRTDESSELPTVFDGMVASPCVMLEALPRPAAEQLVSRSATAGVSPDAARRWARRGRCVPLAMVEAFAEGVMSGEVAWVKDVAVARNRRAGLGPRLGPADWIKRRLQFVPDPDLDVLTAAALLGADVPFALLEHLVHAVSPSVDLAQALQRLQRSHWLQANEPGICALPSRSHREVVLGRIADARLAAWHAAASDALENKWGPLGRAEAARHAALAKDFERAAALARGAADVARACGLASAEGALRAFAADVTATAGPGAGGGWTERLKSGEWDGVPTRLCAIASLSTGSVAPAMTLLRKDVQAMEDAPPAARSRALLAYAISLAVAGRSTEALYQALMALAQAREGNEPKGELACVRFLARLSAAAGEPEAAFKWQEVEAGCLRRP